MSNGQSWKVNGKNELYLIKLIRQVFSVKSFELIKVELKIKMDKTLPQLNKLIFFEK